MSEKAVAMAVYERLEQELMQERSRNGMEFAKMEAKYQKALEEMRAEKEAAEQNAKNLLSEVIRLENLLQRVCERTDG